MLEERNLTNQLTSQKSLVPAQPFGYEFAQLPKHGPESAGPDSIQSLAFYWRVLVRRRFTVLLAAAIVVTLVTIWAFKMKPVYRATASIEVDSDTSQPQVLNENYQQAAFDQNFLSTQVQIVKANDVALRTIDQLRLDQNLEFAGPPQARKSKDPGLRRRQLLQTFKGDLSVSMMAGSRIILIGFESTDPELAARVANAMVENYIEYSFHQKYDATRKATGRMELQLDELKAKVENSQRALVEYEQAHSMVIVNDKQSAVEQRLGELTSDMTQAQNDRIQKQAVYDQVRTNPDKAIAQDELLQRLRERLAELRIQYGESALEYGQAFPKVIRLKKQVADAEAEITAEQQRITARLRGDFLAAVARNRLLESAVASQKAEAGSANRLLVEHNILKGEFDTNQQLYQRLMQRLKDATVTAGLSSANVHLVDTAYPPTGPVRPQKPLYITIGLILGLTLGTMLAFVQEAMDSSLRSPEAVQALIKKPLLAMIPRQNLKGTAGDSAKAWRNKAAARNGNDSLELAIMSPAGSSFSEAFRGLRTSILLSLAKQAPVSVLFTSANMAEGKSTVAVNVALAMALRNVPVVVIDCDLRKPRIHTLLGLPNTRGMSTYLTGTDQLQDVMLQCPQTPYLHAITAGPIAPNPAELLFSEPMASLLAQLRPRFKHIIIDSPPMLAVSDATVLSVLVDGVVLVVESGSTPKKLVERSSLILEGAGAKLLGVVLNKVRTEHEGYYYGAYQDRYS